MSAVHEILAPEIEEHLRAAVATAKAGDELRLPAGSFHLKQSLTIATKGLTIRGAGLHRTTLDFSSQARGAQSMLVLADDVTLVDFRLVNPPADGIVVRGGQDASILSVGVEWTNGPLTSNGGYGIYPVMTSGVRIENCYARGASEAGIYVGQSAHAVVTGNTVEGNVTGIDVENSGWVRVDSNIVRGNSVGIVVASRSGLASRNTFEIVVKDNEIEGNNLTNFAASGAHLAVFGEGKGVAIVAANATTIEGNRFADHDSTHILLLNSASLGQPAAVDPLHDPNLDGTTLRRNEFEDAQEEREAPSGESWRDARGFDIVWDGVITSRPVRPGLEPQPVCRDGQSVSLFTASEKGASPIEFSVAVPECPVRDLPDRAPEGKRAGSP